jgi:hypothetical protein
VDVFEPSRWNPFPIVDDESHQAHVGKILRMYGRSTDGQCMTGDRFRAALRSCFDEPLILLVPCTFNNHSGPAVRNGILGEWREIFRAGR